jgi:hypothetical protein
MAGTLFQAVRHAWEFFQNDFYGIASINSRIERGWGVSYLATVIRRDRTGE